MGRHRAASPIDNFRRPTISLTPAVCIELRRTLGLSASRLAFLAGVAERTVRDFESETVQPRPGTLIALQKGLRAAAALPPGQRA